MGRGGRCSLHSLAHMEAGILSVERKKCKENISIICCFLLAISGIKEQLKASAQLQSLKTSNQVISDLNCNSCIKTITKSEL